MTRNLTANLLCSRDEDGTFCPVRVLGEATRNDSTATSLLPTCAFANTCDSSCRKSYLDVRSRLGCCAASWYGISSGSPLSTFGKNFATCNVSLTNPCPPASGAATTDIPQYSSYYASVGGATRHTVIALSVVHSFCLSVCYTIFAAHAER